MSVWEIAAAVLIVAVTACLIPMLWAGARAGLVAMEVAGTVSTTVLVILGEAENRQPFLDLAIVLAVVSNLGAIAFARLLEREL